MLDSGAFLLLLLGGALLFHAVPARGRAREAVLGLLTLGGVALGVGTLGEMPGALSGLVPFALFLAAGHAGLRWVLRWPSHTRAIAALLAVGFLYLRHDPLLRPVPWVMPEPYLTVGLSYILFRMLHLVLDWGAARDAAGDTGRPPGPLGFLAYVLFFPALPSGPIHLYPEFRAQLDALPQFRLTPDLVARQATRIAWGYAKILIVGAVAQHLLERLLFELPVAPRADAVLASGAASFLRLVHLYVNFSGGMDIALGGAALFGLTLPENFRAPWEARSFFEFWERWHITLSTWFKTYLFNPILRLAMERPRLARHPYAAGLLGYFLTFSVMGYWHGASWEFVGFGLALGVGSVLNKSQEVLAPRLLGKARYKALRRHGGYGFFTSGITLAYISVALNLIWFDGRRAALFTPTGWVFIALTALACAVCWWLCLAVVRGLRSVAARTGLSSPGATLDARPWLRQAVLVLLAFLALASALNTPEGMNVIFVVYEGF